MTSLASILGLLPMALGWGRGSVLYHSLGARRHRRSDFIDAPQFLSSARALPGALRKDPVPFETTTGEKS